MNGKGIKKPSPSIRQNTTPNELRRCHDTTARAISLSVAWHLFFYGVVVQRYEF